MSPWNDNPALLERLEELVVKSDKSFAQVADALNVEFRLSLTRSAVMGKSHRLGLVIPDDKRLRLSYSGRPNNPNNEKRASLRRALHRARQMDAGGIPFEQRRSLLELTDQTCRWPVGDPRDPEFFFCGAEPVIGHPYCPCHCALAYNVSSLVPSQKHAA